MRPIRTRETPSHFALGFFDGHRFSRLKKLNIVDRRPANFYFNELYAWGFYHGESSNAPFEEIAVACLASYSAFMSLPVVDVVMDRRSILGGMNLSRRALEVTAVNQVR